MRQSLVYACIEISHDTTTNKCENAHQALRYRPAENGRRPRVRDEVTGEDAYRASLKFG